MSKLSQQASDLWMTLSSQYAAKLRLSDYIDFYYRKGFLPSVPQTSKSKMGQPSEVLTYPPFEFVKDLSLVVQKSTHTLFSLASCTNTSASDASRQPIGCSAQLYTVYDTLKGINTAHASDQSIQQVALETTLAIHRAGWKIIDLDLLSIAVGLPLLEIVRELSGFSA